MLLVLCILLAGCRAQSSAAETTAGQTEQPSAAATAAPVTTVETEAPEEPETTVSAATETEAQDTEAPEDEHFYLSFVGDCTLGGDPFNAHAAVGFLGTVGEDTDYPLQNVEHMFAADDFTLANLNISHYSRYS